MRRILGRGVAVIVAVGLSAGGAAARAQGDSGAAGEPAPAPDPAVATELTRMFDEACLRGFPDDAATAAFAAAHGATPLTPAGVKGLLHDDPGRGWYLRTPLGLYGLTLEAPPFHACALRRMTPVGIADAKPFAAAAQAFARARGLALVRSPPLRRTTPQGMSVTLFALSAKDASGALADNLMLILTNYHGRPPDDFRSDAKGSLGVEVRMVVQQAPAGGAGEPPAPAPQAAPAVQGGVSGGQSHG